MTGRSYEDLIDAAIIRACRRHDLRTSSIEGELVAKVGRRLTEEVSAELRAELALAVHSGHLPRPQNLDALISDSRADSNVAAFLRHRISCESCGWRSISPTSAGRGGRDAASLAASWNVAMRRV